MVNKVKIKILIAFIFVFLGCINLIIAVEPFGAEIVDVVSSSRATPDAPTGIPAQAGNVTELNIFGYSSTQSWQGYYGNVSGTIILSDSNENMMYNWSLASPRGEIYASTNDSISWGNIQCFNFNADGTYSGEEIPGETNQYGTNLNMLEEMFGISSDDVDGVDETFTLFGVGGHKTFYTNNLEFSEGECMSTRVFTSSGQGEQGKFEEVLLYDPLTYSLVFASLLNQDETGFDNNPHDFEMLVLENGHKSDVSTTPYYFWVELE